MAEVADGRLSLEQTATRVCELVVPEFADLCVLDVVHEGGLRRLAVKLSDPNAGDLEARVRALPLPAGEEPRMPAAVDSGGARLMIPLKARGRTLGVLTLLMTEQSGRDYTSSDLRFFEVVAGRVALALDNAGLFVELQTMEAQLSGALGSLSEAVTIQNVHGNLIYANQAAAEMMGLATPSEVLAQPNEALLSRYDFYHEDGSRLDPREFPGRRVLAGSEPASLVMRVFDRHTGEQAWRLTKASAVTDSAGRLTMVVNVIADITAVKRAELAQRLLAQAGELFSSSVELKDTLQRVADLCVPQLADWCTVRVIDEQRRSLESVAVAHTNPERVTLVLDTREHYPVAVDDPGGLAEVFRTGQARCANAITDQMLVAAARDEQHLAVMRALAPYATLMLPLTTQGTTVGVLTLVSAESRRRFDDRDIDLAAELARRAATAVETARLYTERSRIAATLQDSLLPDTLPALPGWATASLYLPAGQEDRVGGDFYEAILLGEQSWLLVVGDVTGRGTTAASMTAMMRHTLRAIATFTGSAIQALEKLNRDLVNHARPSPCTAVCVVLRECGDHAEADIICAGHPLPLLLREGRARYVGEYGPILGAYADEQFEAYTLPIRAGDMLVLYSDGVLDTVGAAERFGQERLQTVLSGATSPIVAVERTKAALAGFQTGAQHDDVALVAVERLGTRGKFG